MSSPEDNIVIKGTLFFVGACFLIIAFVGSVNIILFQTKGVKTQAQVLEISKDSRYHSHPGAFKYSTDLYKVKVRYIDQQGVSRTQWAQAEPEEKERFKLTEGAQVPFIYVPGFQHSAFGTEAPSWLECIIANLICVPLALFFFGWAIRK